MASSFQLLTRGQFDTEYANRESRFEYWYGEARERSMPTTVHGRLQFILMQLLEVAGMFAASEVELRIDENANPLPEVIADWEPLEQPYPTRGVSVAIEVVSANDSYSYLKEKCRKYREWGFSSVYAVDPSDRSVSVWEDRQFHAVETIISGANILVARIWEALDRSIRPVAL